MRKWRYAVLSILRNRPRLADWPWRDILADAGLLAAFVLTSSLLIHR